MNIIGRSAKLQGLPDLPDSARSTATCIGGALCRFENHSNGDAHVRVYRSDGDMDRGGVVIRLTIDNPDCAMVPTARIIENGVELHMAGDEEAEALCRALQCALSIPECIRTGVSVESIKVDVVPLKHD